MNSNNKNYKRRILLNRITFGMIIVIIILAIVFTVKLISVNKRDKNPSPTDMIIVNTAPPAATDCSVPENTDGKNSTAGPGETDAFKTPEKSSGPLITATPPDAGTPVPPTDRTSEKTPDKTLEKSPEKTQSAPTKTPDNSNYTDITIINAGDIMFHMAQVRGANISGTDSYDFWPTYQYVAPIVQAADLAVVNFESTLYDTNYSGYPGFNSPVDSLKAIKQAGFDTLLFANNHCYDKELVGVKRTLAHFREYGFSYLGATDDLDARPDKSLLLDVNGIKVGMVNYADSITYKNGSTYTINDLPVRDGDWDYLNMYVNQGEEEYLYPRIERDVKKLKDAGADIIIAYMHWGVEYELTPNDIQKKTARKLCDEGVDIIIGSHPHVVQGMDFVKSSDGSREAVCFYSLGNFVSNQNRLTLPSYSVKEYTENGLMVKLFIRKYADGRTELHKLECIPTWVHRYGRGDGLYSHEIIPLPVPDGKLDAYGLTKTSFGVNNSKAAYEMTYPLFRDKINEFNKKHE